jgi:hypothetical protein
MTPKAGSCSSRPAALLITIALWFLPTAGRSRYCSEWMAELDEMERRRIAQMLPALRILLSAPAVGRALGTPRRRISLQMGRRISLGIGDRLFATNDSEGYWYNWQITKPAGGLGRRYRDRRFDFLAECGKCRGFGARAEMPCMSCCGTGRVALKM